MREIKFRAKAVECLEYPCMEKGQWVYGHSLRQYESGRIEIDGVYCDPDTLGQYTGVKDSKGKEIYEEDILEWKDMKDMKPQRGSITFLLGAFRIKAGKCFHYPILPNYAINILGNIYDNPDLLRL